VTGRTNRPENAGTSAPSDTGRNRDGASHTDANRDGTDGTERGTNRRVDVAPDVDLRSTREAATYAHVNPGTIHRWVTRGLLSSYGTPGKRLIDFNELRALVAGGPTKRPPT
jgi:hypothetical protein